MEEERSIKYEICFYGRPLKPTLVRLLGRSDVAALLRTIFYQQPAEVHMATEIIEELTRADCVKHHDAVLKLASNLIFIPESLISRWRELLKNMVASYIVLLSRDLPTLSAAFARTRAHTDQGFHWEELCSYFIPALVMDLGVGHALRLRGIVHHRPIDCWIWIYEGATGTQNSFGVRRCLDARGLSALYDLWHAKIRKILPAFKEEDLDLLHRLARSETIAPKTKEPLLRLRYCRIVQPCGNSYELGIPVFLDADARVLLCEIKRLSLCLTDQIIIPQLKCLNTTLPVSQGERADAYRMTFFRMLMLYACDEAIERQIIPPFPLNVPSNWGVTFWGQEEGNSLI